jgi:hypothetical protein
MELRSESWRRAGAVEGRVKVGASERRDRNRVLANISERELETNDSTTDDNL